MVYVRRYEAAFSSALSLTNIDVVSWLCTQVDSGILQQVCQPLGSQFMPCTNLQRPAVLP